MLSWLLRMFTSESVRPEEVNCPRRSGTAGGLNKPLNDDAMTGWPLLWTVFGWKRDENFKLSVLMRLMSRRQLEIGSVAGLTVAFPRWWRMMRVVVMTLVWTTSVYSEIFTLELTLSVLSEMLLDPVNTVLSVVATSSWTALTESAVYPIRSCHGNALEVVPLVSGVLLVTAYVVAAYRATGLHFLYPGAIGVSAAITHFIVAALYRTNHHALIDELGRDFNHECMGLWLVINNLYPPDARDLQADYWATVRSWISLARKEILHVSKLDSSTETCVMPSTFSNSLHAGRPTVVGNDRLTCLVSSSNIITIANSKVPLILTPEEDADLRTFRDNPGLEGGGAHAYSQVVLDKQPKRQSELRYCIDDVGYVVDITRWHNVRRNSVISALDLLASMIMFIVPSVGAKIVSAAFSIALTYFADISATGRWVFLHFKLASYRAATLPDGDRALCRSDVMKGLQLSAVAISIAVGKYYDSFQATVLLLQLEVLLVTAAGHLGEFFADRCLGTECLGIKPDGFNHGNFLVMKRGGGGSTHAVGKNRLVFSRSRVGGGGTSGATGPNDLHVNPEPGSHLIEL